jgi:hypothetical protein
MRASPVAMAFGPGHAIGSMGYLVSNLIADLAAAVAAARHMCRRRARPIARARHVCLARATRDAARVHEARDGWARIALAASPGDEAVPFALTGRLCVAVRGTDRARAIRPSPQVLDRKGAWTGIELATAPVDPQQQITIRTSLSARNTDTTARERHMCRCRATSR